MVEHVLVVERVCAPAVKRELPQPCDVFRCERPETIRTQCITVDLDLNGMPFDVFRRRRRVMMPDEAPNGRPHGSSESELGKQSLCTSRQPRIHQQIDVAHRSQSGGRVEHMSERGALEDDGVDSGSVEGIENFTENHGVDVVAATMANGQSEELPSSVGGKSDTGTIEVLVKEGGKSMASPSLARSLQSSTRRASAPKTNASSSSQTIRALRVSSVASAESDTALKHVIGIAVLLALLQIVLLWSAHDMLDGLSQGFSSGTGPSSVRAARETTGNIGCVAG